MTTKLNQTDESEAKFKAIVSSSQDAIVMMDNQGKIYFWNNAAEKMFGYTFAEVKNKILHQLITVNPEHRNKKDNLNHFFATGQSPVLGKIIELPVKNKKGDVFSVELTVSSAEFGGIWYGVGIMRDMTNRKKIEAELQAKIDELQKLNNHMTNRELKMIELKKEIEELKKGN